jgi:C2 domain
VIHHAKMAPDDTLYSLHSEWCRSRDEQDRQTQSDMFSLVIKAVGLLHKAPKAYVKFRVNDLSMRTNVMDRTKDPVWNEEFQV